MDTISILYSGWLHAHHTFIPFIVLRKNVEIILPFFAMTCKSYRDCVGVGGTGTCTILVCTSFDKCRLVVSLKNYQMHMLAAMSKCTCGIDAKKGL